jgi:predicted glycosyltransferase
MNGGMAVAEAARAAPRVMLYSQDGRGLGHLRRAHAIGTRLAEVAPDAAVLTVTDSPLGRFFESPPGHDYLKLPSVVKVGPGEWRSLNLPLPVKEVRALRADLVRTAALHFRPDVLLVDHMPHGAQGELLPALDTLRAWGDTSIVLGLRDIIDAPDVVRQRWRLEGAYDTIERFYDRVLVYGEQEIFDLAEQYGMPAGLLPKLRYCGYLCTPRTARYARRIRQELMAGAEPGTRLVVAMAGGGADAYPLMRTLLEGLPLVLDEQPCRFVLITGPFMPRDERRRLQDDAAASDVWVRVREKVSDTLSYIDAADALVTMAGYNTTVEVLRAGRPVVMVPRAGPSAEQRMRTALFSQRGWIHAVPPEELGPPTLAASVLKALDAATAAGCREHAVGGPALDGLGVAVHALLEGTAPVLDLDRLAGDFQNEPADDALAV